MNDYNFFSEYKPKKVKKSKGVKLINIVFILVVFIAAGFVGYNYYILQEVDADLSEVNEQLLTIKTSDDYIRVLEKDRLQSEIESVVLALEAAGESIEVSSNVSENLLAVLAEKMPNDVALTAISISENKLEISGTALNEVAIAEYQHRLKQVDFFESVFLPGINGEGESGNYTFSFAIQLGGERP